MAKCSNELVCFKFHHCSLLEFDFNHLIMSQTIIMYIINMSNIYHITNMSQIYIISHVSKVNPAKDNGCELVWFKVFHYFLFEFDFNH